MEFYFANKKNEIKRFSGWKNIITLCKISQSHKDKYFMCSLVCKTKEQNQKQIHENKVRITRKMKGKVKIRRGRRLRERNEGANMMKKT
jgi:hypothetical protein